MINFQGVMSVAVFRFVYAVRFSVPKGLANKKILRKKKCPVILNRLVSPIYRVVPIGPAAKIVRSAGPSGRILCRCL